MRGTEIYIFHGFQVVKLRNQGIRALTEKPPSRKTLFSFTMAGNVGVGLTLNEKVQLLVALTWRKPKRDVNSCSNYSPSPLYDSREGEKWGIQENRK